jgi:hypothetical protein
MLANLSLILKKTADRRASGFGKEFQPVILWRIGNGQPARPGRLIGRSGRNEDGCFSSAAVAPYVSIKYARRPRLGKTVN